MNDQKEYRWYIVQVLSGSEKKIVDEINKQARKAGCEDLFSQLVVPVEHVQEIKKGQKVNVEKKFMPGYILAEMVMNDSSWHLVRSIAKVSGFLGSANKPQPISAAEVKRILHQIEEKKSITAKIIVYVVGESVKINDGPFESFVGVVEEVETEKQRLKVAVSIFGRSTPVELEYSQVSKVN